MNDDTSPSTALALMRLIPRGGMITVTLHNSSLFTGIEDTSDDGWAAGLLRLTCRLGDTEEMAFVTSADQISSWSVVTTLGAA